MDVQKEIISLRRELEKHNRLYYVEDAPIISDYEYDMLMQKLKALEGKTNSYAVWFGGQESGGVVTPDGSNGKFEFDGQLSVYPVGGGVNEVVDMNISIAPSTPITFSAE